MELNYTLVILIGLTWTAAARADVLRTVAFSGTPAPGTSAGVNFRSLGFPALNDSGQTAFLGFLTGTGVNSTNNGGIWSEGGAAGCNWSPEKALPPPARESTSDY